MADDRRLAGASLTVDGAPLPTELYAALALVKVEESVHLPDAFTVRFEDPHFDHFDSQRFKVGGRIGISFQGSADLVEVSSGEITALCVEQGTGGRHELVLTGFDVGHRLARGPKSRSFQQMTVADIAGQIADEYGLDADISATSEVLDHVLQSSETDFAFLRRLAGKVGFDFWITERTLHLRPQPTATGSPPTLVWGTNLTVFRARLSSSEHCEEVVVRGWDPVGRRALIGRAVEGEPGTSAPVGTQLAEDTRNGFGQVRRFAGQFPVSTQSEADALASSLLLRSSGDEIAVRGTAQGDPRLAAGAEVQIDGVGERLSGKYVLTSVEHVYGGSAPYLTRFWSGSKEPSGFVDLVGAGGGTGGAAAGRGGRGWGDLAVGIVTNSDDPMRLGRVRVKFPTLTEDDESTWARVVGVGAGPTRGLQCLPSVADEVLVGFEHGDTGRPVVIGGLWNGEDKPPDGEYVVDGEIQAWTWTSRSGHSVVLRDDPDKSITVRIGDGDSKLVLTKDKTTLAGENKVEITGAQIAVTAQQSLKLDAPTIEISGSSRVKVSGGMIELN
ncbi:MAG: VgrG-related protein [Actinomycetota bacterium]|nr:VgrG-related protein [Actinomycetota bacterium]